MLAFQHRHLPRPEPGAFTQSSLVVIQVLKRRGAIEEALRTEQELIEFWLAAAHEPDASAKILDGAARRLLKPSNEKLRDAPQALELALQANERSGQRNPRHLNTLAQAYMLTGDSGRATQVWKQAIALLPDDQARAEMLNGAAWELLTVTPETLRDPAAALELALRANELSGFETDRDEGGRVEEDANGATILRLERPARVPIYFSGPMLGDQWVVRGAPLVLLDEEGALSAILGQVVAVRPKKA